MKCCPSNCPSTDGTLLQHLHRLQSDNCSVKPRGGVTCGRKMEWQWKRLLVTMLTLDNNVNVQIKVRYIYDDIIAYLWFVKYVFVLCFNSLITDQKISREERLHRNIKFRCLSKNPSWAFLVYWANGGFWSMKSAVWYFPYKLWRVIPQSIVGRYY